MILLKVLEHDLHRSRSGSSAVPIRIHVPARSSFVPAIVSSPNGNFVVCRYLTDHEGTPVKGQDGFLPCGVFEHDSDVIDDVIDDLFGAAFNLAHDDKLGNIFDGADSVARSFEHVQKSAGVKSQPHVCLVPREWSHDRLSSYMGSGFDIDRMKYRKSCRVTPCKISFPVFLSRPDYVGQMTQFLGGMTAIVLHNVKHGMAFPTDVA